MNKIKLVLGQYKSLLSSLRWGNLLLFTPGALVILVAVTALLAPRLLLVMAAVFCLTLGILISFIAYKFLTFKAKLEAMAKKFDGQVIIQGVAVRPSTRAANQDIEVDPKKIVFH